MLCVCVCMCVCVFVNVCVYLYVRIMLIKTIIIQKFQQVCSTSRQSAGINSDLFRRLIWPTANLIFLDVLPYFCLFACCVSALVRWRRRRRQRHLIDHSCTRARRHDAVIDDVRSFRTCCCCCCRSCTKNSDESDQMTSPLTTPSDSTTPAERVRRATSINGGGRRYVAISTQDDVAVTTAPDWRSSTTSTVESIRPEASIGQQAGASAAVVEFAPSNGNSTNQRHQLHRQTACSSSLDDQSDNTNSSNNPRLLSVSADRPCLRTSVTALCVFYAALLFPKLTLDIFIFAAGQEALTGGGGGSGGSGGGGGSDVENQPLYEARKMLAQTIVAQLWYIHLAGKFFVFVATSKSFRVELGRLVGCRCCDIVADKPERKLCQRSGGPDDLSMTDGSKASSVGRSSDLLRRGVGRSRATDETNAGGSAPEEERRPLLDEPEASGHDSVGCVRDVNGCPAEPTAERCRAGVATSDDFKSTSRDIAGYRSLHLDHLDHDNNQWTGEACYSYTTLGGQRLRSRSEVGTSSSVYYATTLMSAASDYRDETIVFQNQSSNLNQFQQPVLFPESPKMIQLPPLPSEIETYEPFTMPRDSKYIRRKNETCSRTAAVAEAPGRLDYTRYILHLPSSTPSLLKQREEQSGQRRPLPPPPSGIYVTRFDCPSGLSDANRSSCPFQISSTTTPDDLRRSKSGTSFSTSTTLFQKDVCYRSTTASDLDELSRSENCAGAAVPLPVDVFDVSSYNLALYSSDAVVGRSRTDGPASATSDRVGGRVPVHRLYYTTSV